MIDIKQFRIVMSALGIIGIILFSLGLVNFGGAIDELKTIAKTMEIGLYEIWVTICQSVNFVCILCVFFGVSFILFAVPGLVFAKKIVNLCTVKSVLKAFLSAVLILVLLLTTTMGIVFGLDTLTDDGTDKFSYNFGVGLTGAMFLISFILFICTFAATAFCFTGFEKGESKGRLIYDYILGFSMALPIYSIIFLF